MVQSTQAPVNNATATQAPTANTPALAPQQQTKTLPAAANNVSCVAAFSTQENFIAAQRMAGALSASSLVPKEYQGNVANCLIAMELASRIGASVFMVMQHLNIIHGRPSFGAQFVIATANASGRFTPLRFEWVKNVKPDAPEYGCRAIAIDKSSGEICEGAWITWSMVSAEGWLSKSGTKWKTMPGQMFMYRAASFWAKIYAPELLMGMQTAEEIRDIVDPGTFEPSVMAPETAKPEQKRSQAPTSAPVGMAGLDAAMAEAVEPEPPVGE